MKKALITTTLALAVSSLTACGPKISTSQITTTAPMSQEETGYVLQGVALDDLQNWAQENPETRYRVINKNIELYEVYNTTKEELKNEFADAKVERNQFFESQSYKLAKKQYTLKHLQQALKHQPFDGDEIDYSTLNDCKESPDKAPVLDVRGSTQHMNAELEDSTINLGDTFGLTLGGSASQLEDGKLKMAWMVYAPKGSLINQQIGDDGNMINAPTVNLGANLVYTPDTMGAYYFLAVAQDSDNVCTFAQFPLIVTSNEAFDEYGAHESASMVLDDMTPFWQLPMTQSQEAHQLARGAGVKIAVIDSGVNYNHPALAASIAINGSEIPGNGIDDDANGFVDDVVGYDFLNSDEFPFDDSGHGSHVAAAAASHVMGVAPDALIIPIKALSGAGGDAASITGAIYYAVAQGAHVINLSLGSYGAPPEFLLEAYLYAAQMNVQLVAAAGNGHPQTGISVNNDEMPAFPASLDVPGLISVAATANGENITNYSNFGVVSVDLVAPGGDQSHQMVSAFSKNAAGLVWAGMQGTSMASPVVAGVAALVRSANPTLDIYTTKDIILTSGVDVQGFQGITVTGKLVNSYNAVNMAFIGQAQH